MDELKRSQVTTKLFQRQVEALKKINIESRIPVAVLVREAIDNFLRDWTPDYFLKKKTQQSQSP